jgi:SAM-dependent methyltransferase
MLIRTKCPIDDSNDSDIEVYPANFDLEQLTPEVFSARRTPDRLHYRMVRNTRTGCLRADPVLDMDSILALYNASKVTEQSVAGLAAETYARYLPKALARVPDKRGAIEIGCGHGVFLPKLLDAGFERVVGVEPSADAVEKAEPRVRACISRAPLRRGSYEPDSFSLACGFQVLDHLSDPNEVLSAAYESLVAGGVAYWICHDVGSLFARFLGERCPIVDVEHVVLYDKKTIAKLFERNGFKTVEVFGVHNYYPLEYWAHLAPLPAPLKQIAFSILKMTGMGRLRIDVNFGNMGIIARK